MQAYQSLNVQTLLTEKGFFETLDHRQKGKYNLYYKDGIVRHKISLIFNALINFGLTIGAFTTLIKNNEKYISYSNDICNKASISSFTSFWCDIGNYEIDIINSYFVFLVLFMSFEIFTIFVHKDITKLEIKGILYYIIIGIDSIFLVIFYIFIPLFFFLFLYSILVISILPNETSSTLLSQGNDITPESEKKWKETKKDPIINSILLFLIFALDIGLLNIKKPLILYFNMKFEKVPRDKTKNASMNIGGTEVKFKVKSDKIIYLSNQTNKIYRFKEAKIEGRNDPIYIRLDNKSIDNLFSFSNFDYPNLDEFFLLLGKIAEVIYGLLFVSIPLSKCHLNNDVNYIFIREMNKSLKIKYNGVFSYFGVYENSLNKSRIALYCIALFIILLFIIKRVIFGGFGQHFKIQLVFYLVIIFIIENVLYFLLTFLCILFSIFSVVCYSDSKNTHGDGMVITKIFLIMGLNFIIFWICVGLMSHSSRLCKMISWLKNEVYNINNNITDNNLVEEKQFTYIGLNMNNYSLNESPLPNGPRNVFYTRNIIKLVQINNIQENNRTQIENNEKNRNAITVDIKFADTEDKRIIIDNK